MRAKARAPSIDVPVVAFGAEAKAAREGCFGVLLGVRRAKWIDVVRLAPVGHPHVSGLAKTIDARFGDHAPWDAVGIALPHAATRGERLRLIEALVPGDVLATEKEVRFHAGDRFKPARVASV